MRLSTSVKSLRLIGDQCRFIVGATESLCIAFWFLLCVTWECLSAGSLADHRLDARSEEVHHSRKGAELRGRVRLSSREAIRP